MTAITLAHPRPRPRNRLDHASVVLLRSVMAENWQAERAGRDLLRRLHDDRRTLELLRARVARALLGRPTRIAQRAAATVDCALSALAEDRPAGIPQQRDGHA